MSVKKEKGCRRTGFAWLVGTTVTVHELLCATGRSLVLVLCLSS